MKTYIIQPLALFACLLLGSLSPIFAQNMDKAEVEKQVKKLFQDYEYYGALVESFNDEQVSESMISQFKNLFEPSAMVYNDIKQSDNYGKKVTLTNYVNELKMWYPSGLSVTLSPPQVGNINCNKGRCQAIVPVVKAMGGLTKDKKDFRDSDILANIVVSFDDNMKNFKISEVKGMDETPSETAAIPKADKKPNKKENKEERTETAAKTEKPKQEKEKKINAPKPIKNKPVKTQNVFAKGNQQKAQRSLIGAYTAIGWTWLGGVADFAPLAGSKTLSDDLNNMFAEDFKGTRPLAYNAILGLNRIGLNYQRYMGEKWGFTLGLGYHQYSSAIQGDINNTTYNVAFNTAQSSPINSSEPDGTNFVRHFEAKNFREVYRFSNITLSLAMQYQLYAYVRNNAFRPYLKAGLDIGLVSMANHINFEGKIVSSSTYAEQSNMELQYDANANNAHIYNDIYWLYNFDEVKTGNETLAELMPKANAFNISPVIELGFDWLLSKNGKWCASAAAQVNMGLMPLFANLNTDIYSNSGNILLKRNYAGETANDAILQYSPMEADKYEYRSIHAADASTAPQFLGFIVGVKYIFKQGNKNKVN